MILLEYFGILGSSQSKMAEEDDGFADGEWRMLKVEQALLIASLSPPSPKGELAAS